MEYWRARNGEGGEMRLDGGDGGRDGEEMGPETMGKAGGRWRRESRPRPSIIISTLVLVSILVVLGSWPCPWFWSTWSRSLTFTVSNAPDLDSDHGHGSGHGPGHGPGRDFDLDLDLALCPSSQARKMNSTLTAADSAPILRIITLSPTPSCTYHHACSSHIA